MIRLNQILGMFLMAISPALIVGIFFINPPCVVFVFLYTLCLALAFLGASIYAQ